MPQQISSNGFAGGCFLTYAVFGGISPLTCTIFDPTYFWVILRNHVFHISPTRLKFSIMGNYLDFADVYKRQGYKAEDADGDGIG